MRLLRRFAPRNDKVRNEKYPWDQASNGDREKIKNGARSIRLIGGETQQMFTNEKEIGKARMRFFHQQKPGSNDQNENDGNPRDDRFSQRFPVLHQEAPRSEN